MSKWVPAQSFISNMTTSGSAGNVYVVQQTNPPPGGGEKVAINIPPVQGKTPAQVAIELRMLLKKLVIGGSNPATTGKDLTQGITHIGTQRDDLQKIAETLNMELNELVEIAKTRRPSEIKKKVVSIKLGSLSNMNSSLRKQRDWIGWLRDNFGMTTTQTDQSQLQLAYALVQALPTVENSTTGKDEQIIRAIKAVLKVHEGIDPLHTFEGVQMPEVPLVLVHEVEKVVEKVVEIAREPALYFIQPFRIGSKEGQPTYDELTIKSAKTTLLVKGSAEDGIGNPSDWNNGKCTIEQAADAFRAFCNRYSTPYAQLKDGQEKVLAERTKSKEPIQWFISDVPKSTPVVPTPF